jgi:hypothetical protein
MYDRFSKVCVGAIAGVTTVMDTFWQDPSVSFPYPSMAGSGDRMSICWAIFGKAPDLSLGIGKPSSDTLYHACQGLSLEADSAGGLEVEGCAAIEVYHTCRGSNTCKAQGGCGFAQWDSGGGSCGAGGCGAMRVANPHIGKHEEVLCGGPTPSPDGKLYSAPSDNKCASFGGCAVPISASQLFPDGGTMKLYNFGPAPGYQSEPLGEDIPFEKGEVVYDVAWRAYSMVMAKRGQTPGDKPQPSDVRIALPPST